MNILIAEDDPSSRLVLLELLLAYGRVDTVVNGREAVFFFGSALDRKQPYDLVCLDIMMPDMDGRQALREIRDMEKEQGIEGLDGVKTLMITALNDSQNVIGSFRDLCDGYLIKPIEQEVLLARLNEMKLFASR